MKKKIESLFGTLKARLTCFIQLASSPEPLSLLCSFRSPLTRVYFYSCLIISFPSFPSPVDRHTYGQREISLSLSPSPPSPPIFSRTRVSRVYSTRPAFHSRHAHSKPRPAVPFQLGPHESRPHPHFSREVNTPGRTGGKYLLR